MTYCAPNTTTLKTVVVLLTIFFLSFIFINSGVNFNREFTGQLVHSYKSGHAPRCDYTLGDFITIVRAIERAMNFYESTHGLLLDSVVGSRTLEAQLGIILNEYGGILPIGQQRKLKQLRNRAKLFSEITLKTFMDDRNIETSEKTEQSVWVKSSKLWAMPKLHHWKAVAEMESYFSKNTQIEKKNYFRDLFYGSLSDKCILQQFSCNTTNISRICKEYFFTKPRSSYTLNHQIIYFILAEMNSCHKTRNYKNLFEDVGGWTNFRKDLCGKAWFLANVVASKNFTPRYSDLFTEQVAVCSLAGYPNFLKKDWLHKILSWQSTSEDDGCFLYADLDNRLLTTVLSDDDYIDVEYPQNKSLSHLKILRGEYTDVVLKERRKVEMPKAMKRRKRHEEIVESKAGEDCLVHLTSMGIMALSMHLRYLVETCLNEIFV